ncbi:amidase family protein [Kordiimonas pumila]|uniref:Amidase family protein n=1 Tax=Kordiimonas pumila TaxID=2161677 RepID=A0ABV7D246_9PROT|nr:amidase family protein [Kordiimonas pumila]
MKASRPSITKNDALKLGMLDAHDQAALLRCGDITALELVEASITRAEALDPELNSISYKAYDDATARAFHISDDHSPMSGVPYLLKDGLDYPDMPAHVGSKFRVNHPYTAKSYPYTNKLDQAGLIPIGKSNATEFGLLPTTEPTLYGPVHNPWSLGYSTGGSSGGAAAAVAAGIVPLAHAADGGGSIRIPASCCGVVGMKPGRGANLRPRGQTLIDDYLVADSLLSRTVRDTSWGVDLCHPTSIGGMPNPLERPLKIAVIMNNLLGEAPHPAVETVIRRTADLCASLGHKVEYVTAPVNGPAVYDAFRTIWAYQAHDIVASCTANLKKGAIEENLEPWTLDLAKWAESLSPLKLEQFFTAAGLANIEYDTFFDEWDVILSPVLKEPPVELDRLGPLRPFPELLIEMFEYVSYTPLHNLTGAPSISLPLFMADNFAPIGSLFSGRQGSEKLLLELSLQLEQAMPWRDKWPQSSVASLLS